MNQAIKDRVYTQGNQKWVEFISVLSGMSHLEQQLFQLLHNNNTDAHIMADLGMTQKTFDKVEESVAKKLLWAVLYCIDYTMKNDK